MRRICAVLFWIGLIVLLFAETRGDYPAQLILIRHGEKGEEPVDLDPQGLQRAQCLVDYFTNPVGPYNTPNHIYAMKQKHSDSSNRAVETVQPLADALDKKIHNDFEKGEEKKCVDDIIARYPGKTVLVCWEHDTLVDIAAYFGACTDSGNLDWGLNPDSGSNNSSCYNANWILTFDDEKKSTLEVPGMAPQVSKLDLAGAQSQHLNFSVVSEFDVLGTDPSNFQCVYDVDPNHILYSQDCKV